ncbi:putative titin [Fasciolopsis buskii]|uniref:Putative titin n=1 Tax=Fasciolopsis buskii TaxID=27845 RepID=A0A8E0RW09_9TREM|nr:putative titin [Fasciolopsis buski]
MIQAKNVAGESTVPVHLFITSEPVAPKGPLEVKGIHPAPRRSLQSFDEGRECVRLQAGHSPLDDGGAPVKDYIVEACLDHALEEWRSAGTSDTTNKRVDGLLYDAVYTFRVSARNEADKVGPPLYSEVYKPAAPIGPPGPPTGPLRARCTGKGLQPGGEYRFRVRAENRAGAGPPLESDKPIVAASPFGPPGAPVGPIMISEVQKGSSKSDGSARISWNPPIETGELPVLTLTFLLRCVTPTHSDGTESAEPENSQASHITRNRSNKFGTSSII